MRHAPCGFNTEATALQWLALADRRLSYFTGLYRNGRWTHYRASPEQFAEQMQEAIKVARVWARLASVRGRADDGKHDLRPAA
jgi:hypothetical protein